MINLSDDRESFAKAQHHLGKKVVGYLSCNIPLEIIQASGAVPLHLSGKVDKEPNHANEYMEAAFDPITRSVFDRLLDGDFDFVDLIVLPRCNDSHQRLYYYIREIQRKHPQYTLPPVYLVDLLHTTRESSATRNLIKFSEFKTYLEKLFSCSIDQRELEQAVLEYNQARGLLKQFQSLQANTALSISSEAAYQIYTSAQSVSAKDFNLVLKNEIAMLKAKQPSEKSGLRLVVAGNGLDHPGLHRLVDSMGATIVGEYTSLGSHFLSGHIDQKTNAPLNAITEHYHQHTISSRTFNPDPQHLITFAQQQNADGIVFYFMQGEEALTWQVPKQKLCAAKAGIPVVSFYDQNYEINTENVQRQITDLINRSREF